MKLSNFLLLLIVGVVSSFSQLEAVRKELWTDPVLGVQGWSYGFNGELPRNIFIDQMEKNLALGIKCREILQAFDQRWDSIEAPLNVKLAELFQFICLVCSVINRVVIVHGQRNPYSRYFNNSLRILTSGERADDGQESGLLYSTIVLSEGGLEFHQLGARLRRTLDLCLIDPALRINGGASTLTLCFVEFIDALNEFVNSMLGSPLVITDPAIVRLKDRIRNLFERLTVEYPLVRGLGDLERRNFAASLIPFSDIALPERVLINDPNVPRAALNLDLPVPPSPAIGAFVHVRRGRPIRRPREEAIDWAGPSPVRRRAVGT